jgi:hypothetical protein
LRRRVKSEFQRKTEAKRQAARELQRTKQRLGLRPPQPPQGVPSHPLIAKPWVRSSRLPSTSDRIPGFSPKQDLMHRYKWKRGAEETSETIAAIKRKATQIRPAYNKGALQYLPRKKGEAD